MRIVFVVVERKSAAKEGQPMSGRRLKEAPKVVCIDTVLKFWRLATRNYSVIQEQCQYSKRRKASFSWRAAK